MILYHCSRSCARKNCLMRSRSRLIPLTFFLALASTLLLADTVLYNGIRLPEAWPPHDVRATNDPQPIPPYLVRPPAVIPIDVGRQLLVDDFLVESTDLRRTFHRPEYYAHNPVLKADKRWEFSDGVGKAMPYSDG